MHLKSDKKINSSWGISKLFKNLYESAVVTFLIAIGLIIFGYLLMNDFMYLWMTGGILLLLLLMSNGAITEDVLEFWRLIVVLFVVAIPIAFFNIPIKTVKDSMDAKPYIKNVVYDKECGCSGTVFVLKMDKPFQKELKITLSDDKYIDLIQDKNELKKFTFTAEKTCNKFYLGTIECQLNLLVGHEYVETVLSKTVMKDSVYPKKLDMWNNTKWK